MLRLRSLDPCALLLGATFLAAGLTYFLPAGEFPRAVDPQTGRVVIAGDYHPAEPHPVNAFGAVVATVAGLIEAADVIFPVMLIGGAFYILDRSGALLAGVQWLSERLAGKGRWAIITCCLAFALGGVLEGMQEELVPLVPVLLLLSRRLGLDAVTMAGMTLGAALVGGAFSPLNPFLVGMGQKLADVPLGSGALFRTVMLLVALLIWIVCVLRYAQAHPLPQLQADTEKHPMLRRHLAIHLLWLATFGCYLVGVLRWEWGLQEMAALFLATSLLTGVVAGMGIEGTSTALVEGARSMTGPALLIGLARGIKVVLAQGKVLDTIVASLVAPLDHLPLECSAVGMLGVQTAIHVAVPSNSGQAGLSMPIMVPIADLLHISRQIVVLAFQGGAGLCDMITPTNGGLMAFLAAAGVRLGDWFKLVRLPLVLLYVLTAASLWLAIVLGWS